MFESVGVCRAVQVDVCEAKGEEEENEELCYEEAS